MKHYEVSFRTWLHKETTHADRTIETMSYMAYKYQLWLDRHKITIEQTTYQTLLDYIVCLRTEEQRSRSYINNQLNGISHYYRYKGISNMAYGVRLRGTKTQAKLLLTSNELDYIYEHYQDVTKKQDFYSYSNKILLGLFIYQAADLKEILNLFLEDLDLQKGTIRLPAGKYKKNSRIVKLESHQIIPLHEYIHQHRNKWRHIEDHDYNTNLLFAPQAYKYHRLSNQFVAINKSIKNNIDLKGIHYQSLRQLRQSRIAIWIKQHGLRQAQYLSGMKHIIVLEKLQRLDIEDLADKLKEFHPLQ